MKVTVLSCEHLTMPRGLDMPRPHFTWKVNGGPAGGAQSAYSMLLCSDMDKALMGCGDVWESEWILDGNSAHVRYEGPELEEEKDYYLRVRVMDRSGLISPYSKPFKLSTAFFKPNQSLWDKLWLSPTEYSAISPMFRRVFVTRQKPVKARMYITGIGYYQLFINGSRVGAPGLAPDWTEYSKRVLYNTFDVTDMLDAGSNCIGVRLGDGWFITSFCKAPQFALRLHLFYADGSDKWIDTSKRADWLSSYDGEIRRNGIYDGETIDARLCKPGWSSADFDVGAEASGEWRTPLWAEPPAGRITSALLEEIKVTESWPMRSCRQVSPDTYVLDAGQNISGWVHARVSGARGQTITLMYAEDIWPNGDVRRENLRTARATDTWILSGNGEDDFAPAFTFHGFRYVRVEGLSAAPDLDGWRCEVVRSAVESCGDFNCSDALLESIQRMCRWTECTNLMGLPTDCPQRDERLGWLNDMTVRAEEALYNFKLGSLYSKWLCDISDAQGAVTGAISDTAPFVKFGRQPADPVCSSYLLIPWYLYAFYGDRDILVRHYSGMRRWVEYLVSQADADGTLSYSYFGDWASPAASSIPESNGCGAVSSVTPGALMSTGYLFFDLLLMADIADTLGKPEDVKIFGDMAKRTAAGFIKRFYDADTNLFAGGSQGSSVFALYLGLCDNARTQIEHIARDIEKNGGRFTTGNQTTKYLLDVLSENAMGDLAYDIVRGREYPGWGYMLSHGATTVWERWENVVDGEELGMASLNHPMNATVSVWFFKHLCGIRPDARKPGFSGFTVSPIFPQKLKSASANIETVKGGVSVSWTRLDDGKVRLRLRVPYNSAALFKPPFPMALLDGSKAEEQNENEYSLPSGDYLFVG